MSALYAPALLRTIPPRNDGKETEREKRKTETMTTTTAGDLTDLRERLLLVRELFRDVNPGKKEEKSTRCVCGTPMNKSRI
ncbi:hypothetical protein BV898_05523 [Hypsibius exemplaris]|uniref:Uncharacterized protein n=1 Tax=Hypsibius exemplaris TaxID=2072580 RepID=A0A1W0WZ51_HYPEX|nr:hypothetical protein BV898_05523 [Hypsibius exemplaris]